MLTRPTTTNTTSQTKLCLRSGGESDLIGHFHSVFVAALQITNKKIRKYKLTLSKNFPNDYTFMFRFYVQFIHSGGGMWNVGKGSSSGHCILYSLKYSSSRTSSSSGGSSGEAAPWTPLLSPGITWQRKIVLQLLQELILRFYSVHALHHSESACIIFRALGWFLRR